MLTSWPLEKESLPEAIDIALKEINWDKDNVIIEGRRHELDVEIIRKFVQLKNVPVKDEAIGLFDQYYLPIKQVLSQPLR